jgi:hypothetical protein
VVVKEITYVEARPQMWTSLFSVALIYLLESAKDGSRRACLLLPALMLLWANMHGGFVLGDVVIAVYVLTALVFRRKDRAFYFSSVAAVLASGLNPNGFAAFLALASSLVEVEAVQYWQSIVEDQSIFSHASFSGIMRMLPYLAALGAVSLLSFVLNIRQARRMKVEFILLYVMMLLMGLKSIRYIIFFAQMAALVTALNLRDIAGSVGSWGFFAKRDRAFGMARALAALPLIVLAIYATASYGARRNALGMEKPYQDYYSGAVDFIRQNDLRGSIFNEYTEGGYLIWWLWPRVKVFADGRGLSFEGFRLYKQVVDDPMMPSTEDGMTPVFMSAFWKYDINIAVMPGCDRVSGITIPLSYVLLNSERWEVVYADRSVIVFMRNTPANREFIEVHRMPKAAGYSNILAMAKAAGGGRVSHVLPGQRLSMAIGYMGRGEKGEALRWVEEYLRLKPGDKNGIMIKRRIEQM